MNNKKETKNIALKNDSISFEELKKLEGNPVWFTKEAVWCLVQQAYEGNGKKEVLIVFLEKDDAGLLDTNNIWVKFEEDSFYRFQKNDK